MDALIYDRETADVGVVASMQLTGYSNLSTSQKALWDSVAAKGAWNYTDANRVEEWLNFLWDTLFQSGYTIFGFQRHDPNWTERDEFYLDDITRIRTNLNSMHDQWAQPYGWTDVDFHDVMTRIDANLLEQNIKLLNDLIGSMTKCYIRAGMPWAVAGNNLYIGNG